MMTLAADTKLSYKKLSQTDRASCCQLLRDCRNKLYN